MAEDDSKLTSSDSARAEVARRMLAAAQCRHTREYDKAIEHYEAAVKLADSFGPRDLDLGRALFQLASAHLWCSKRSNRNAAGPAFTRALTILEENLPAAHPEVIAALRALIRIHLDEKEGDRGERLIRRFFPIVEQTRGLLHQETLELLLSLGSALRCQHKHAEADEVYAPYLKAAEAAWGPDDVRVIEVVKAMAGNFLEQGNAAKAESLYRRALATVDERRYYWEGGYSHWKLIALLSALAGILTEQARYEEAEKLLRRLLDLEDRKSVV